MANIKEIVKKENTAQFDICSVPVKVVYRPHEFTGELEKEFVKNFEGEGANIAYEKALARVLVSWDITEGEGDKEKEIPITQKNLARFSLPFKRELYNSIQGDMLPNRS